MSRILVLALMPTNAGSIPVRRTQLLAEWCEVPLEAPALTGLRRG